MCHETSHESMQSVRYERQGESVRYERQDEPMRYERQYEPMQSVFNERQDALSHMSFNQALDVLRAEPFLL